MKKDLGENDECLHSASSTSKPLRRGREMLRADWSEGSKAIARDGDDHLILGEFSNLQDENLEWRVV